MQSSAPNSTNPDNWGSVITMQRSMGTLTFV